jgi:hypothetical protein
MTMPHERTRAVVHTRQFLVELTLDETLPAHVRDGAHHMLRHYPFDHEVFLVGKAEERFANASSGLYSPYFSSSTEYKP